MTYFGCTLYNTRLTFACFICLSGPYLPKYDVKQLCSNKYLYPSFVCVMVLKRIKLKKKKKLKASQTSQPHTKTLFDYYLLA